MSSKRLWLSISLLVVFAMVLSACQTTTPAATEAVVATEAPAEATEAAPAEEFVFGMLLVGPYNDKGYSEAHYNAGLYVEQNVPGTRMIYIDNANTSSRPGTTGVQLAEELLAQGAKLIIFNSDDMKADAIEFTKTHPEIPVIHASGDSAWADGKNFENLANMVNIMGRMEYGKMIAGCAAALTTQSGQIGYLGPLINDETRRLAASAYLGAKYCWETYRGNDPAALEFKVTWIGFWFNLPGITSDPTQVADDFYNSGFDVVMSGIDTTEALVEAGKMTESGKQSFAIPYDYEGACDENTAVCLGVPYFNWGPLYVKYITQAIEGNWATAFEWGGPDWADINNPDTSTVGFVKGTALSEEAAANLDSFIAELAGGLNLWTGPLNLQDGSAYLADGEVGTDVQVWYLPQLLEGMEGQSISAE